MEKHDIIMEAFMLLWNDEPTECREFILKNYPFDRNTRPEKIDGMVTQKISDVEVSGSWDADPALKMRVFKRDGFVNRFDGKPVVLIPVLQLLSTELPAEFPYQDHWKAGEIHIAYNELGARANKLIPPTRGGKEELDNLITTTMPHVNARGNALVDEVGWPLKPVGNLADWDGLSTLFVDHVDRHPELKKLSFVKRWYPVARKAFEV